MSGFLTGLFFGALIAVAARYWIDRDDEWHWYEDEDK